MYNSLKYVTSIFPCFDYYFSLSIYEIDKIISENNAKYLNICSNDNIFNSKVKKFSVVSKY